MQSVVASIVRMRDIDGFGYVERLHGTGFFFSNDGHLLTARHVIEKGEADVEKNGGYLAFCPKRDDGSGSLCIRLLEREFAPAPFDVALATIPFKSKTFYRLRPRTIEVWQDVAAVGYPMSTTRQGADKYEVFSRFHRGYIQRVLRAGDLLIGRNPPAFEVSFPITLGMSGGPLFVHTPDVDLIVGICVGSIQSRVVAYEDTRIVGPNEIHREEVSRIEEIGIAHSLLALSDWKPSLLKGQTLSELSDATWAAA